MTAGPDAPAPQPVGVFDADELAQVDSFAALLRALQPGPPLDRAFRHSAADNVATTPAGLRRGERLFGPGRSAPLTASASGQHGVRAVTSVLLSDAVLSPGSMSVLDGQGRLFRDGIENVREPALLAGFDPAFTLAADGTLLMAAATAESDVVALPVCSHGIVNFGHFHLDGLPAVLLHAQLLGDQPFRIVGQPLRPWQRELLEGLGLLKDYLAVTQPTRFRRVLTSTMLSLHLSYPTRFIRPVFDTLRFSLGAPGSGAARVFLSRGKLAENRRVLRNRGAVEAMLAARGFTIAHPHRMTVCEQVQMMADARIVVGETGAGLTNCGYCDPGTKVLEIQPDLFLDGWPRAQSFLLAQQWHLFLAKAERDAAGGIAYDVDPQELAAALDAMERPADVPPATVAPPRHSHLLSHHGQLVCRDPSSGRVMQRPVDDTGLPPLSLGLDVRRWRDDPDRFTADRSRPMALPMSGGDLAGFTVILGADRRLVTIQRDGRFMSADAQDGRITLDREAAHDWERFLLLSPDDLAQLRLILSHDWVLGGSRVVQREAVAVTEGQTLALDHERFALRQQLPFQWTPLPQRLTLLRDGWRIEPAALYRPLVYFCAFGDPAVLEQLYLCLRSLLQAGEYHGHVHVITDLPAEAILARVPSLDPARFSTQLAAAVDRAGFILARYRIADWPEAAQFQPVLYADVDSVFNAPVAPMLAAVAAASRICAPLEPFSPLATAPSVGASLIQRAGHDPGEAAGFNSGTLGIPNLATHGDTLRLIARVTAQYGELVGRERLGFVDQPSANYVAFRTGRFDTQLLSQYVAHGFDAATGPQAPRTGLVHFWPRGTAEQRVTAMRDYMRVLGLL